MSKVEHRRFTAEQKLEILREAEQPGVTVSAAQGGDRTLARRGRVMQTVAQTQKRSGWRVYRTLAALGVARSATLRCATR